MAVAITVDQKESRRNPDQIRQWLPTVNNAFGRSLKLEFVRTAGDEMQGLLDSPEPVVELVLDAVRSAPWWLGIGIGSVDLPLGQTSAESRGTAFYNAREALLEAKDSPYGFAVVGDDEEPARAVAANLTLLASLAKRRGPRQWEAVELLHRGLSQKEIGRRLGISQQAVSQRLRAAGWQEELEGRWLASWLLAPLVEIDA